MAAQAARFGAAVATRGSWLASLGSFKVASLAEKLDEKREAELRVQQRAVVVREEAARRAPARQEAIKSFSFHLGADIQVPTDDKRNTHTVDAPVAAQSVSRAPFEGLPLRAWAERMGERIMPAYELIKEEKRKADLAAKDAPPVDVAMPNIPHLLPFTRWAAQSKDFRDTFIAGDAKTRKKARLSWYHPDDTMVPRDWFRGGLLEDLKYYAPFSRSSARAEAGAAAAPATAAPQ